MSKFADQGSNIMLQYYKSLSEKHRLKYNQLKKEHTDFFIFGHRHLPLDLKASDTSRYINLGEWINYCTYAEFDGEKLELNKFEN